MNQQETWALEPHLCRACGGRILRRVGGPSVMTPGGNPIFKCANCGTQKASMGPGDLCWCGFAHRLNNTHPYRCLPFSVLNDAPELEHAFRACGCDPQRGEVGIVLTDSLKKADATRA